jgi:hypothetical protein
MLFKFFILVYSMMIVFPLHKWNMKVQVNDAVTLNKYINALHHGFRTAKKAN